MVLQYNVRPLKIIFSGKNTPRNFKMSVEELTIRGDLEMGVERDLEEEIKDAIYHQALKLHQLYQHKKPKHFDQKEQIKNTREYMSELNINIRMEGGTIIQVKEIKKDGSRINRPTLTSDITKSQPNVGSRTLCRQYSSSKEVQLGKECSKRIEPIDFCRKILPNKSVGYVHSSTKHGCAGKSINSGLKNEVLKVGWKY